MSLDRDEVLALQRRGLRDWLATLATGSPGSELFERDGIAAALVPASPKRSIVNSVTYRYAETLAGIHVELDRRFGEAGIQAWSVWVPDFDQEALEALEARGHSFDGKPAAMALELRDWQAPQIGDLDWDAEATGAELGRINDAAYGLTSDGMAPALADPPPDVRLYRARVDGEVACVFGTIDHDRDLGFYFVATDAAHRGRGLASRLMSVALEDARERGLETSSLQASPMGEPVYARMGYRPYFRMHLYERRRG